jgi:hypothetical protein
MPGRTSSGLDERREMIESDESREQPGVERGLLDAREDAAASRQATTSSPRHVMDGKPGAAGAASESCARRSATCDGLLVIAIVARRALCR